MEAKDDACKQMKLLHFAIEIYAEISPIKI